MTAGDGETVVVEWLANLRSLESLPFGARVLAQEDGWTYTHAGQILPEITERIGWKPQVVWLPGHVLDAITMKHNVLQDPVRIAGMILREPTSVHLSVRSMNERYFVIDGEALRSQTMLGSRSVRLVDAVVELRPLTNGDEILRLFHLSPTTRNKGGRQLWP